MRPDRVLRVGIDGVDGAGKTRLADELAPRVRALAHIRDAPVDAPTLQAAVPSVLLLDGILLHRPELRDAWDYSIFLQVSTGTSVRRCATRDGTPSTPLDPTAPTHARYVLG